VKFQSYVTEDLVTAEAQKAGYQIETTGRDQQQYEMLKTLELTQNQQAELKSHCDGLGILYLSTPYEERSADFLEYLGVAAFKIASTDITNTPFLSRIAKKGMHVILSTGMSTLGEVEDAVSTLKENGLDGKIVLLHCTSEYPAPIEEINLRAMQTLELAFNCPVGFSDHSKGIIASPWAVALGACIIEKHVTLDRNMEGPDHRSSLEPKELRDLIIAIRTVERALGDGIKKPSSSEIKNKPKMQKSLVAKHKIAAGKIIKEEDLACKRPANGLPPSWMDRIIGKRTSQTIEMDSLIKISAIHWELE